MLIVALLIIVGIILLVVGAVAQIRIVTKRTCLIVGACMVGLGIVLWLVGFGVHPVVVDSMEVTHAQT